MLSVMPRRRHRWHYLQYALLAHTPHPHSSLLMVILTSTQLSRYLSRYYYAAVVVVVLVVVSDEFLCMNVHTSKSAISCAKKFVFGVVVVVSLVPAPPSPGGGGTYVCCGRWPGV